MLLSACMQPYLVRAEPETTDGGGSGETDFFSEIGAEEEQTSPGLETGSRVSGFVKQDMHYAVRDQTAEFPFSREDAGVRLFRSTLNTSLKGPIFDSGNYEIGANFFYDAFYHHSGDADVTADESDNMADEAEWREVFINVETADDLWLKFGRQIVAWGESDFTQILDLVNPRDERESGLVDLENARLPILATRASYIGNRWGADLVLTHEFEPNRFAGEGSDFDPLITLRGNLDVIGASEPDVDLDDPGYLGRIFLSSPYGDVSFIYGKVYDRVPVLQMVGSGGSGVLLTYPEIEAAGIAANWVKGFWLLKAEFARKSGVPVPLLSQEQGILYEEKALYQLLAGLEYSGFQDLQISAEWVTNSIDGYEATLAQRERESFLSSRLNFEFWRDTAAIEVVWARWITGDSDSVRTAFNYELSDEVKLSLGYIGFAGDINGTLYPYRNNDRAFASIRYSF